MSIGSVFKTVLFVLWMAVLRRWLLCPLFSEIQWSTWEVEEISIQELCLKNKVVCMISCKSVYHFIPCYYGNYYYYQTPFIDIWFYHTTLFEVSMETVMLIFRAFLACIWRDSRLLGNIPEKSMNLFNAKCSVSMWFLNFKVDYRGGCCIRNHPWRKWFMINALKGLYLLVWTYLKEYKWY